MSLTLRIAVLSVFLAAPVFPQDTGATFEAASIKPYPQEEQLTWTGCQGGPGSTDPGRIECRYVTVKYLMMQAYGVKNREISGPDSADSVQFNILAKVPSGSTRAQVRQMYRNLLAERFKLTLHHETRQMTAYAMTIAKGGSKLKETDPASLDKPDDPLPPGGKLPVGEDGFPILRHSAINSGPMILYRNGRARLQAGNTQLGAVADMLSGQLDQWITDETGLTGKYDISVTWTPDPTERGGRQGTSAAEEASAPAASLFSALEAQLGLKLVPRKEPRDILVIDHTEKSPTEN